MKKYFLYIEFILVFLFFILPPLFVNNNINSVITTENLKFSIYSILSLTLATILFYQFEFSVNAKQKITFYHFLLSLGKVFFYFGVLLLTYIFLLILSIKFDVLFKTNYKLEFNFKDFILILLNFLCSAFYEESIYRLFLPTILICFFDNIFKKIKLKFFTNEKNKKHFFTFIEILCIFIFAFSHRYLGIIGIINAFISGTVLRLCAKKNQTILIGTFAHFFYNTFILSLAFLI